MPPGSAQDYFAIDKDENLWVRRKLARDPDLLHNFVSKAENISAETVAKHESRVLTRWRKPA